MPTTTDTPERPLVLPLTSEAARNASLTGGKAAALARLTGTGLPIPPGFIISTAAYDAFTAAHHLSEAIEHRLAAVDPRNGAALEAAAADIRARIEAQVLPDAVAAAVRDAWERLAEPLVAVRSSATMEDLPAHSFAGQHESFLNVAGPRALRRAILACWSSLWTARAIAYRAEIRYGGSAGALALAGCHLSMAILVQTMIPAEYAGVAFTANPVTGRRDEIVIEAVRGLGDALVSGTVVPERMVPEEVTSAVRRLAERVGAIAGEPQDVEWAWTDKGAFLLQSRPITSLFPLPDDPLAATRDRFGDGLRAYLSFGAIQGMLDPMTPLGRDNIRGLFSGAQKLFGLGVTWETERVLVTAAERLWLDVTPLLHHRIGRRLVAVVLSVMEPRAGAILREIVTPRIAARPRRMRLRTALRLPRVFGPMALRLIGSLVAPDWSRRRAEQHLERLAEGAREAPDGKLESALALLEGAWQDGFPTMLPHALPRIAAGVICQRAIGRLTRDLPDAADASLIVSRGVPHNVTTDMNRALWAIAQEIRGLPPLRAMVATSDAAGVARAVLDDRVPPAIERLLATFLERYGARGLAEIDLGRVRWSENPAPVLQALQAYVRADGSAAPEASSATAGRDTTRRIGEWQHTLRARRGGFTRAWLLTFCISRARALGGLREAPKFAIMRRLARVRGALREAGEALAREGLLDRGEDIFFLHVSELRTIAAATGGGWRTLVQERRERDEREMARTHIPLVLLSDGSALFGVAAEADDDGLRGTPVSPGSAEGVVRVLDHPTRETLTPGEILVCRGTDPSWTPLFLAAAGLITEVGGVMSHGAIVARECGLPAIVGVPEATTRLKTGQEIRIDGGSGRIWVIRG